MNVIVHDTHGKDLDRRYPKDTVYAMRYLKEITYCQGCFGCWIKTPGACVIKDELKNSACAIGNVTNFYMLTKITYGGYSSLTKLFLDRSLGYAMPYFTKREEEMHHKLRYDTSYRLYIIGYGATSRKEEDTFQQLVRENTINFKTSSSLFFAKDEEEALQLLSDVHEVRI